VSGEQGPADRAGQADRAFGAAAAPATVAGRPVRILFVCLGNICRSPTAEAVMRRLVEERGLSGEVKVDSAGTGDWHVGERPDERACAAAERRGLTLEGQARQVRARDFEEFDLILAMDGSNALGLRRLAPDARSAEKVRLLREFDSEARDAADLDVPDPYHGGREGFERVIDLVTAACEGVLDSLGVGEATKR
jgi:protein-tyrosine phosphatase